MSLVRRFDHVGITVADLDAVTSFFVGLGHASAALTRGWSCRSRWAKRGWPLFSLSTAAVAIPGERNPTEILAFRAGCNDPRQPGRSRQLI